jgi:hypothetical protein
MSMFRGLAVTFLVLAGFAVIAVAPVTAQEQKRIAVVQSLYNYLIYPNFLPYVENGVVPDFFATPVRGCVAPLGEAQDVKGVMNLLVAVTSGQPPNPAVSAIQFRSILASRDRIAVEVDITQSGDGRPSPGSATLASSPSTTRTRSCRSI